MMNMMNNMTNNPNLVMESNKTLKAIARQALSGHWLAAMLVVTLNTLVASLPVYLIAEFTTEDFPLICAQVYSYMVAGPLSLGLAYYFLKTCRAENPKVGVLFDGFKNYKQALGLYVNYIVRVFLWSLLFLVPGIIAAFRFSMAFFILADNPEKTPAQCLAESNEMMFGNKMRLFYLLLSFIGWFILAALPTIFVENSDIFLNNPELLMNEENMSNIFYGLFLGGSSLKGLLASLPGGLVMVYVNATQSSFYEIVSGKLVTQVQSELAEESPEL